LTTYHAWRWPRQSAPEEPSWHSDRPKAGTHVRNELSVRSRNVLAGPCAMSHAGDAADAPRRASHDSLTSRQLRPLRQARASSARRRQSTARDVCQTNCTRSSSCNSGAPPHGGPGEACAGARQARGEHDNSSAKIFCLSRSRPAGSPRRSFAHSPPNRPRMRLARFKPGSFYPRPAKNISFADASSEGASLQCRCASMHAASEISS